MQRVGSERGRAHPKVPGKPSGGSKKLVGDWQLERRLGQGSFASVFLASHVKYREKLVAIKAISRSKLNKKLEKNLQKEVAILRDMKHVNIVQLFETKETGKHIYLVMEYCAGGDLHVFLRKHGKLPLGLAQRFMIQLAHGMHYLWSQNLIHRDLKPQNLLLTERSENAVLKIADFGFARQLGAATMAETMCGSPLYMAPEILDGKSYDSKADLWSSGTILYEMLVGKPPFYGSSPVELLRNIVKTKLRFPLHKIKISQNCMNLIQKLLTVDPIARISFEDFYDHPFLHEMEEGNRKAAPHQIGGDRDGMQKTMSHSDSSDSLLPGGSSIEDGDGTGGGGGVGDVNEGIDGEEMIFMPGGSDDCTKDEKSPSDQPGKGFDPPRQREDAWEIVPSAKERHQKHKESKQHASSVRVIRYVGEVLKRATVLGRLGESLVTFTGDASMDDAISQPLQEYLEKSHTDPKVLGLSLYMKTLDVLTNAYEMLSMIENETDENLITAAKITKCEVKDLFTTYASLSQVVTLRSHDEEQEVPKPEVTLLGLIFQFGQSAGNQEAVARASESRLLAERSYRLLEYGLQLIELLCADSASPSSSANLQRTELLQLAAVYRDRLGGLKDKFGL